MEEKKITKDNPFTNTTIAEREAMRDKDKCRVCGIYAAVKRGRCRSCDYKNLEPLR